MIRRNTKQRDVIRNALSGRRDHPTAEQVHEAVVAVMPDMSLATVYRNLGLLADEGEIKRVISPGSPDRFDPDTSDHSHFYCIKCGAVLDFAEGDLPQSDIKTEHRILERQIIYKGYCRHCVEDTVQ